MCIRDRHIPNLADETPPTNEEIDSQLLYSEPNGLNIDTGLPSLKKDNQKGIN